MFFTHKSDKHYIPVEGLELRLLPLRIDTVILKNYSIENERF